MTENFQGCGNPKCVDINCITKEEPMKPEIKTFKPGVDTLWGKMTHIVKNKIGCQMCGDMIESKHRHHFVTCSCGAIGVDGGHDYLRRVGDMYIELSIYFLEDGRIHYYNGDW